MDDLSVKIKKLNYLYDNSRSSMAGVIGIATVVFFTLYGEVDNTNLAIWYAFSVSISIFRLSLLKKYNNTVITEQNIKKYTYIFSLFVYLTAISWAIIPFYILPENILYFIFVIIMIGGLTSGASISLAINNTLYKTFTLITLLPYIITLYFLDNEISTPILITLILYLIFTSSMSKKMSFILNNSIDLTYKNKNLIKELKKKAIEAEKASEAKSNFLSTMSHEIRTPLNAIIGFIKLLTKTEKDSTRLKYLNTIDQSSHSLLNVINDILDFSKIESGKFRLDFTEFDPKKELTDIYELYSEVASEGGVTLINSISDDLPKNIKTDKLRLKQIISNLVSNAIKFTPENKNVEFIAKFNKDNSSLYIEIKDEGIGIEKEKISLITDEFTQADNTTARKYGGTGLGLSIVLKLLKLLKSELHIDSEVDKGSRFYFNLQVNVLDAKEEIIEAEDENINFENKYILVAEDNKTNQMLIKLLLEDIGIDVKIANDGSEAEKFFKENKFDLVLMDINMPNKNGIEAMKSINEYQKNNENKVAIIALTANSVSGDREKYLDYGFENYLAKPIDTKQLIFVLKKYLT